MRTHLAMAALTLSALAGPAARGAIESQTINFDYDFINQTNPYDLPIQGFDNMGGTRQLNEIRFLWNGTYDLDYTLENTGPTAVAEEDYSLIVESGTLHVYGPNNDVPFYTSSAIYEEVSHALGAYEAPSRDSNIYNGSLSVPYTNTVVRNPTDHPTTFSIFDTPNEVYTSLGGFTFLSFYWINEPTGWDPPSGLFGEPIYPTDDAIWIFWDDSRNHGTLTVEYDFSLVPTPGAAGLLACASLGMTARRRRR